MKDFKLKLYDNSDHVECICFSYVSGFDIDKAICDIADGASFHPFYDCCRSAAIPFRLPKQFPRDIYPPPRFGKGVRQIAFTATDTEDSSAWGYWISQWRSACTNFTFSLICALDSTEGKVITNMDLVKLMEVKLSVEVDEREDKGEKINTQCASLFCAEADCNEPFLFIDERPYVSQLKSIDRGLTDEVLVALRETQLLCHICDELAAKLFREHVRKLVEENISVALGILKSRTRATTEVGQVVEELDKVLAFNDLLISFKNRSDIDRLARGVGPVSLVGGEYDGDRKMEDLKLLYGEYLSHARSARRLKDKKLAAIKNLFGLGNRESERLGQSSSKKKRRGQRVSSGELQMADSKAQFLQKASELNEEIYRQQRCVADGELNDENAVALFEKIVKDAIASGVDGYDAEVKKSVRKAAHSLPLTKEIALSIASKAARKVFSIYIERAQSAKNNNNESAIELKRLIDFNTLVVTELVQDIKGESADVSTEEPVKEDITETEEGEWGSLQSLRKIRPDNELMGKSGQTEITLKDDLPERDRIDLYKTFLTYCLTGDLINIPFGAQKDDSEYLYLNQLGGILGLTDKEIMDVHRGLAKQAFRQQAEVLLADGQLTKAGVEQLGKLQKEIGLSQEYAQKEMAAAIETAVTQGRLNMKQIRKLEESNIDLDSMVFVIMREMLFKKTIGDIFSSGTGEFDAEEVYEKIPLDLNIDKEKARGVVRDLAQSRVSNSLIEAVTLLKQRNHKGVVSSLNNLLACDKAVPSQTLSWEVSEELSGLYTIYLKSDPNPEKLNRLQYLLGINDSTTAALRDSG
ncbi:protein TIC110, chloroplastic [Trifolium repens]|nr:protein TIC110, chloroplastic [Trifolium repens]